MQLDALPVGAHPDDVEPSAREYPRFPTSWNSSSIKAQIASGDREETTEAQRVSVFSVSRWLSVIIAVVAA
jgi:hypothetical protein